MNRPPKPPSNPPPVSVPMGASPLGPHPPRPGFPFGPHGGPLGHPGGPGGMPPGDPMAAAFAASMPNNVSPAGLGGPYRPVSM